MKKEMLINVLQPEECRIAIVENGVLEELYVERASQESYVGNIYKGRIVNIEPSIQAAFVDFGIGRNGFLHVSDVDPAYFKHLLPKDMLAEYEDELDSEHTGGGGGRGRGDRGDRGGRGRDRDRGDRDRGDRGGPRPPREMTGFLEPAAPARAEFDEPGDFGAGLEDTPAAAAEVVEEEVGFEVLPDEAEEVAEAAPIPPPAPKPAPKARHVTEELVEDSDFGAGLDWDEPAPPPAPAARKTPEPDPEPAPEAPDPAEAEAEAEPAGEEPKKKPRARRTKKAEEPAADAPAAEGEAGEAKKPARRRTRKKADGEAEGEGDDKPRFMGGAERRTSAGDDEPEIRPFFDDGDFDPEASNDRFAGDPPPEPSARFADEPESAEDAEEEARDFAHDAEGTAEPAEPAEPVPHTGRGFNDDFADYDSPPPPRGDRGRDRDRGGRGGRDRDRGGPRGGRDRDRDRGGPGRGGPRGGPGGGRNGGRDRGLPKPPIQEIFKRGQEVIVQVIKEGIGTKGPTLSTYVSIAGRYLVLMPSLNRVGVSRKIEDPDARRRLRDIMSTLSPPKGVGFIVRTAAIDRDKKELQNDLAYLLRLWQVVVRRVKRMPAPVEIYRESDMITRTIRDIFTADIDTIWVDEANAFAHASEFLQIVMPRYASRIRYFEDTEPLFHKYRVEEEIVKINQKRIEMPLGGSLVIEQTEALVAIDVNSGNFRADSQNAEETAYQMNLHAAKEIARQLRLRDLGGVIVNDFIDMRGESHRRNVETALRNAMARDRARTKILRISQFGLIEMTRQRIRPSLKRSIFADCAHCRGTGFVKNNETMSIEVMRMLQLAAHRSPAVQAVEVSVHADVAHYLLNKRRKDIAALEERGGLSIQITGRVGVSPELTEIKCFDQNGNEVRLIPAAAPPRLAGGRHPRDRDRGDRRFPAPLD